MDSPPPASTCANAVRLHQDGRIDEAEALYHQILAREPGNAAARHLLGVVRHQQGRQEDALALIDAALADAPGTAAMHANRGAVLKALGRLGGALAACDAALALQPDFPGAWNGRGAALADLDRYDEALAAYDRALALQPGFALAQANRARVLQYLGRLEEARTAYQQALGQDPRMASVYLDYADLAPVAPGDPHLKVMQDWRDGDAPPAGEDGIYLDFALAKAHADLGNPERSFRHLLRGNAAKRARIDYDEAAVMASFDRLEAAFSAETMRAKRGLAGSATQAPIFILGMMRSGSTLVEQVLASHPAVHGAGELAAMAHIARQVSGRDFPDYAPLLDAASLGEVADAYLAALQMRTPGAARITDKMPSNFFFAGLIHLALPNARIIHTLRDPVDNCVSCFSRLFTQEQNHTYELGELGRYYRRYERLMAHWRRVLPPDRILDVRYEDVVADLEGQARRIIAHCGLDWDEHCLAFHATARPVRTASVSQVRRRLYGDAVGRARAHDAFLAPLRAALAGEA